MSSIREIILQTHYFQATRCRYLICRRCGAAVVRKMASKVTVSRGLPSLAIGTACVAAANAYVRLTRWIRRPLQFGEV